MKKIMYFLVVCCMLHTGLYAQDWHLTGNGGTTPGTNFVGTTNAKALMFKVNNQRSGYIDFDVAKANTSFGFQALKSPTSGKYNSAFGYKALYSNTDGFKNTASGYYALYSNTSGYYNTASGFTALYSNTTGVSNTASGYQALYSNTTGVGNTALGLQAMYSDTTGYYNTALGFGALYKNTTGYNNTASGVSALFTNTTGYNNTASGYLALYSNTTGYENTASGQGALRLISDVYRNSAFGNSAGSSYKNGSYCTFVGAYSDANAAGYANSAALGDAAIITASNQVMLGDLGVTVVRSYGQVIATSDGRFKKNIKENVPGLVFINQLRPVTYNFDIQKLNDHVRGGAESKNAQATIKDAQAVANKGKIQYTGFVAQEVEKVANNLGYDFSGVYKPQNDKDVYGLSYSEFVVPLVKAVQELSKKAERVDELEKEVAELKQIVLELKNGNVNNSGSLISSVYLK